ncbi:MAG TPA: hypothetical protein VM327_02400 [Candidatus Thermoplasmatota archaeon]|nr:hypothetical protein [Candidatus Thermoplasmatota archaeon]
MTAALVLAALLMPVPGAQAAPIYLELTGTLEAPVPVADLDLRTSEGASSPGGPCSANSFEGHPDRATFRFREGSDSNGCLGVIYPLTLPTAIRRVAVTFQADRVVEESTRAIAIGPPAFEQEIRLRRGQQVVAASPYFGPQDGDHPPAPFTSSFDLPDAPGDAQIEWWFANRGDGTSAGDPSSGRLQAWSATVSAPSLLLEGIPLPAPALREHRGDVQGESYQTGHTARIMVPPDYVAAAAAGHFSLHLRMPASGVVDRLVDSHGHTLSDDEFATSIAGPDRLLSLPARTLQLLGPGPYDVQFLASEPLKVEPTMAALALAAFLMPAVTLVLAMHQLRRRALDAYLEAADALEGELAA